MEPKHGKCRRDFLIQAVAVTQAVAVAALTAFEGASMPSASAEPPERLFRRIQAVKKDRQEDQLAKGIKQLTPEDAQLAAKLRPLALRVVRNLVEDDSHKWQVTNSADKTIGSTTKTFSTTTKLEDGGSLIIELSSKQIDAGPEMRGLAVKVEGSERYLPIRGSSPMQGVRDQAEERAEVDRLYDAVSKGR